MHTLELSLTQLELLQDLCDRNSHLRIWYVEFASEDHYAVTVDCSEATVVWISLH